MNDLNQLRRLAGVPVDLSKVDNARGTIRTPKRLPFETLSEAASVPKHRGELSPKTKKNMRARVSGAKKALEALELARDELMSLPAIDYMEDIPDVIRQLHMMLHGEDGTGGLHGIHRQHEREYNAMEFPEDLENTEPGEDGNPTEEENKAKEKEAAKKKKENEKKKAVKEGQAYDGVASQKNGQVNSVDATAQDMEGEGRNTADNPSEQEEKSKWSNKFRNVVNVIDADPKHKSKDSQNPNWSNEFRNAVDVIDADDSEEEAFGLNVGGSGLKAPSRRPNLSRGGNSDDTIKPEAIAAAKEAGIKKPEGKNPFEQEEETKKHKPTWLTRAEIAAEKDAKRARGEKVDDEEDCAMSMPMVGEGKKPKWLEKKEVEAEKKDGQKVSKKEEKKVGVKEAVGSRAIFPSTKEWEKGTDQTKKFAADADLNKNPAAAVVGEEPANVFKGKQGELAYPKTDHDEGPNQMQTNPYNESQKVHVPATIKSALKAEADAAQKNADMFLSRKDLDSKNFYEDMAKAFTELHMRLDEGTLYSMKQAQILMTSMMSIFTNKIPPDVVKFIAAGGTVRPLKDYFKQVTGNFDEWHIHPSKE